MPPYLPSALKRLAAIQYLIDSTVSELLGKFHRRYYNMTPAGKLSHQQAAYILCKRPQQRARARILFAATLTP